MIDKTTDLPMPTSKVDVVQAVVFAVIPEFNQSLLRTADGRELAITRHTEGVKFDNLVTGQLVNCVVTRVSPRVIRAWLYCDPPRLAPRFMPEVTHVAQIDTDGAFTVQELAMQAEIQAAESGDPSKRKVVLRFDDALSDGELGPILCEPDPMNAVVITLSSLLSEADSARQALAVLAFALLEPQARQLIRDEPWTRATVRTVGDGPGR